MRHPKDMGAHEINRFLTHLACEGNVAASTQNQALCAIVFLYKHVLKKEVGELGDVIRAKKPERLPVVLTVDEVRQVLHHMYGVQHLIGELLYGTGMRLMEAVRLRVKDVDFDRRLITIRDGKGQKDRSAVLPQRVAEPLREHLKKVRWLHDDDLKAGYGTVTFPPP